MKYTESFLHIHAFEVVADRSPFETKRYPVIDGTTNDDKLHDPDRARCSSHCQLYG